MKLTKQRIESAIEDSYDLDYDKWVLSPEFAEPIRNRNYLRGEELIKIGTWKAVRATGHMKNPDELVQVVTRSAFAEADPRLANWILRYLRGVGAPMASAVLTVFDPSNYTVLDYRAVNSLRNIDYEALESKRPTWIDDPDVTRKSEHYGDYVDLCKQLAEEIGVNLRTLDRGLWALNGTGGTVDSSRA